MNRAAGTRRDPIGRQHPIQFRITRSFATTVLMCLCAATLAGCTTTSAQLDPPAESVRQLLILRSENSTDAAAYRAHVTTDLAEKFTQDSAARRSRLSPIPTWESPKTARETSASAQVKVVWKRSGKFKGWPEATLFTLLRDGGLWRVVDAVDASTTAR